MVFSPILYLINGRKVSSYLDLSKAGG